LVKDQGAAVVAQPGSLSVGPEQTEPPELPFELELLERLGELDRLELLELLDPLDPLDPLEPLDPPEPPLDPLLACAMLRVVRAGAA
jgi:hypothetical protein